MAGLFYKIGKSAGKVYRSRKPLDVIIGEIARSEIQYSTFWARVGALGIDAGIFVLLLAVQLWLFLYSRYVAMAGCVLIPIFCESYIVLMHWRLGQTVGKMVMKLKVTSRDGNTAITLRQALRRSFAGVGYFGLLGVCSFYALLFWQESDWSTLVFKERIELFIERYPSIASFVGNIYVYWLLAELLILLLMHKRRAIHDYIAATVVISLRQPDDEA
jgi:uncharacterized RDD family membrane protein YckC